MVPDRPDARQLLRIAAKVLSEAILEPLDDRLRLEGLMVLRAMAIAERELGQGAETALAAQKALAAYYEGPVRSGDPVQGLSLAKRLAADIRAGRCDTDEQAVHRMLNQDVGRRLRLCNPAYLEVARK